LTILGLDGTFDFYVSSITKTYYMLSFVLGITLNLTKMRSWLFFFLVKIEMEMWTFLHIESSNYVTIAKHVEMKV
jgi:hypothetical protein